MGFTPVVRKRRLQLADGYRLFSRGEPREKHLDRKLRREAFQAWGHEESLSRWAAALDIHPVAAGLSGWVPHHWDEDRHEQEEREASRALAIQRAHAERVTRWYAAQARQRRTVTTAELAGQLGGSHLLEAWAFDLFHLHRRLWRALKRQEAHEAGLTGIVAQVQVRRQETALEALTACPVLPVPPSRVKRPRPVEYRPQVQPNAPTL